MTYQGYNLLRELVRALIRNLGLLEKSDASCCGVTLTQCHAVVEIGRSEKMSLVELAGMLGLEKSTMSRTVNNLVEADLAVRDLDSDNRRYVNIQLTEKGTEVFRNIEESMDGYFRSIFESIPEDKRGQMIESLTLLSNAIRKNKCC